MRIGDAGLINDTNEAAPAIELAHVSKRFGALEAIRDISFCVPKGAVFGLIGHNGAGKSTLFKMMLGLIAPSAGQLRIAGADTGGGDFRAVRRRIGYLPESFVTYDNLTGLEVLRLFADLKHVPRQDCERVLARVGLSDAAGRRVLGYSKGMRQRLGLAQVLLGSPDLIFLDEPTNGLDPEGIHEFYRILREAQARGATIVITSHILAEIQERVDRLLILHSGRVVAQGSLAQLRAQMVLPSVIHATIAASQAVRIQAVLAHLPVSVKIEAGDVDGGGATLQAQIACPATHKMEVLAIVSCMSDTVFDIVIHEPSLEDLFLGYGEKGAEHV